MKRIFGIIAVASTLAACETTPQLEKVATTPYKLNQTERTIIEKGLRQSMKDPASAIIGFVKGSSKGDGIVHICGYVNGKNSFGAYTGNQLYYGLLASMRVSGKTIATFNVKKIGGSQSDSETVMFLCNRYGVL